MSVADGFVGTRCSCVHIIHMWHSSLSNSTSGLVTSTSSWRLDEQTRLGRGLPKSSRCIGENSGVRIGDLGIGAICYGSSNALVACVVL